MLGLLESTVLPKDVAVLLSPSHDRRGVGSCVIIAAMDLDSVSGAGTVA